MDFLKDLSEVLWANLKDYSGVLILGAGAIMKGWGWKKKWDEGRRQDVVEGVLGLLVISWLIGGGLLTLFNKGQEYLNTGS